MTYLTPNEHEAEKFAHEERRKMIVTKGEKGISFYDGMNEKHLASVQVRVVETTGAGDSFGHWLLLCLRVRN
ncbi:PfkB family carbohydrate kinase [Halalkalibacter alkalisediminis]|uniref:PfkB family carbohydrate kinase n=1 Tax=Halalkalibacter alkalisediminis TaxID=935616 RepID=A0ABV6NHN0_9BACI|nr:PfkB family carbohydrate kinase [Halalkalibacter alkalisediminis]